MELLQLFTVALLLVTVSGYRHYQDEIPNGDIVPHPCKPNFFWRGLGHKNPLGGGPRNPFGRDFAKFHNWTRELCMMDSDGDGKRNGEELGDDNCTWKKGEFAQRRTYITHPGVCDPWGSSKCAEANKNVSCETGEFICDGINEPGVINITLRFPPTKVPARETSYMCFTFELDKLDPNKDYHLIATKPYIDNPNVMHHITLSGCDATSTALKEPELCNMASTGCQAGIGLWTLGMPGECVYKEAGFRVGRKHGFHRLNMQHHWTNPELRTDYVDSSGMTIYLTENLRPNNAAYFTTGETHLVIPAGMSRYQVTSTCSSRCTRKIMTGPINLMTGLNHMHYLGYKQNVELFREGMAPLDLTPDEAYSYDNPVVHVYDPPVEVNRGDSMETTCVFRSTSRTTTAMFGEGTFDEMCFGIFTYYPAENLVFPACTTWGDLETCDFNMKDFSFYGCSLAEMFNVSDPMRKKLISKVLDNCNFFGGCRAECPAAIAEVRRHPCFAGIMADYISDTLRIFASSDLETAKFLAAFRSCECPRDPDSHDYGYPMSGAGRIPAGVALTLVSVLLGMLI